MRCLHRPVLVELTLEQRIHRIVQGECRHARPPIAFYDILVETPRAFAKQFELGAAELSAGQGS
jgi:hypothetical protein